MPAGGGSKYIHNLYYFTNRALPLKLYFKKLFKKTNKQKKNTGPIL
jgi:hypothetical protein